MINKEVALTSRKLCKQSCSLKKTCSTYEIQDARAVLVFFLQKLRFLVRIQVSRPRLTVSAREQILRELEILRTKNFKTKTLVQQSPPAFVDTSRTRQRKMIS